MPRWLIATGVGVLVATAAVLGALVWAENGTTLADITAAYGATDSRTLTVDFRNCGLTWDAHVQEDSDTVTVIVVLDGEVPYECVPRTTTDTVTLAQPLGDRRVLEPVSGETVRVIGRDS